MVNINTDLPKTRVTFDFLIAQIQFEWPIASDKSIFISQDCFYFSVTHYIIDVTVGEK
jgi:hypothetical protein